MSTTADIRTTTLHNGVVVIVRPNGSIYFRDEYLQREEIARLRAAGVECRPYSLPSAPVTRLIALGSN